MCARVSLHARFLAVLPRTEQHARVQFHTVKCKSTKEEAIAEVIALAWSWYRRLVGKGKNPDNFVSAIATYAVRWVNSGRRLCGQEAAKDVMSAVAQRQHGFKVEHLPPSCRRSREEIYGQVGGQREMDCYEERLHDNTRTPPDEAAAFRVDFPDWLRSHSSRDRRIIRDMTRDERTKDLAKKYGVTPARISQKRDEFRGNWLAFHGEPVAVA